MDTLPRSATIDETLFVVDYNTTGASTDDGLGQYIIGTFTAAASTQKIELNSVVPQLNAIQLRIISKSVIGVDSLCGTVSDGTRMTLSWIAVSGTTYRVTATTNLMTGPWVELTNEIAGTAGSVSVTNAMTEAQRFYRVYLEE
jgi:hypothetical protein